MRYKPQVETQHVCMYVFSVLRIDNSVQWMDGDIEGLLGEGRTIQHRLNSHHNQSQRSPEHTALRS